MLFVAPVYALLVRIKSDSSLSEAFAIAFVSSLFGVRGRSSPEVSECLRVRFSACFVRLLGLVDGVGIVLLVDGRRSVTV
jgi:hypothetical protein